MEYTFKSVALKSTAVMGASINGHVVHEKSILWLIGSCLKRLYFSTVFDCEM